MTTLTGTEHYTVRDDDDDDPVLVHHPSGADIDTWREGYPFDHRMSRVEYEEQKRLLQIELLKLQEWSQSNGLRHVFVFEGRDAAGKGGTIKRFLEHLNPRSPRRRRGEAHRSGTHAVVLPALHQAPACGR